MQIRYLYTNDMYEFTLEIIFTHDVKRSLKALYKRWDIEEEIFDCEACTVTCHSEDDSTIDITKYGLIFSYKHLTENVVTHEVSHLAAFILDDRSIDLAGGNDDYENFAWLTGHLSELVHQVIRKHSINVKPTTIQGKIKRIGKSN